MLICHTRPKNVKYEGGGQGAYEESSPGFTSQAAHIYSHIRELAWRQLQTSTCAHSHRHIEESTVLRPQDVEAMQTQLL